MKIGKSVKESSKMTLKRSNDRRETRRRKTKKR